MFYNVLQEDTDMKQKFYSQSIRMDFDLSRKVKQLAEDQDRSFNKQVIRILEKYIKDYEAEHGEIHIDSE